MGFEAGKGTNCLKNITVRKYETADLKVNNMFVYRNINRYNDTVSIAKRTQWWTETYSNMSGDGSEGADAD